MKVAKYLKNHPQFTNEDYLYLSQKGYSNKEIKNIWDNDFRAGKLPVTSNKNKIDWKKYNQLNKGFNL